MSPFDPADAGFLEDPYPVFAVLRALGPVHDHPLLGAPVAVSHAACSELLREWFRGPAGPGGTPL